MRREVGRPKGMLQRVSPFYVCVCVCAGVVCVHPLASPAPPFVFRCTSRFASLHLHRAHCGQINRLFNFIFARSAFSCFGRAPSTHPRPAPPTDASTAFRRISSRDVCRESRAAQRYVMSAAALLSCRRHCPCALGCHQVAVSRGPPPSFPSRLRFSLSFPGS